MQIDTDKLREWTAGVVQAGVDGIRQGLLKRRGVTVLRGHAQLASSTSLALEGGEVERRRLQAGHHRHRFEPEPAAAASCSRMVERRCAEAAVRAESLLVVGSSYIGLEIGLVYGPGLEGLGGRVPAC